MSVVFANIKLSNPLSGEEGIMLRCVVDGRFHKYLVLPKAVITILKLQRIDDRYEEKNNGEIEVFSYVGPIRVEYEDRIGFTGAITNEESNVCYIGSILMAELDLKIADKPIIKLAKR